MTDDELALADALANLDDKLRNGSTVIEEIASIRLTPPVKKRFEQLSPLLHGLRHLPRPVSQIGSLLREQANLEQAFGTGPVVSHSLPSIPGYTVETEIGRGGMGVVYRARHLALNRTVAVKLIRDRLLADADSIARFRKEAEIAARLNHPNIVQIYDVNHHDGHWFIAEEFLADGSLANQVRTNTLSPRDAARIIASIADAVQAAHSAGIIHRDLKAANILLAGQTPKLTDFGLARNLTADGMTASGAIVGTPNTMSPEQARGEANVGPPTDIYGLGAVLYESLTGQPPFRGSTSHEVIRQVLDRDPLPPRTLVPGIPRDLETITLKALRKEPTHRYATAADLADDLRRFLAGLPIRARRTPAAIRAWRWARRHPAVAGLTTALLMAIAAGLISTARYTSQLRLAQEDTARQRDKAIEQSNHARAAVQAFLHQVTNDSDFRAATTPQLRQRLLTMAHDYYRSLPPVEDDIDRMNERIATLLDLAAISRLLGDTPEAGRLIQEAAHLADDLAQRDGQKPNSRILVANSWNQLGQSKANASDFAGAVTHHRDAIALLEATQDQASDWKMHRYSLAASYSNLGVALRRANDLDGAERAHRRSLSLRETLPQHIPDFANAVAQTHHNLASVAQSRKDYARAVEGYLLAAELRELIVCHALEHPEYVLALCSSLESAARVLKALGRLEDAATLIGKAEGFLDQFDVIQPGVAAIRENRERLARQWNTAMPQR